MTERPPTVSDAPARERSFWSDARLTRLALGVFIGMLIAGAITVLNDRDNRSLLKSGDFPGFYAPALLAVTRNIDYLYDANLQRGIENRFWPWFSGEYYMSVYPPYTAVLLSPLSYLQPQTARHAFTAASLVCFLIALLIIGRVNPYIRRNFFVSALLMLSVSPVFYGVLGGQNTAFSMLLLVASAYCVKCSAGRYGFIWKICAGIILGLWLYKPQFGGPALLLVLLAGQYLVFLGALIPATGFCLLSYLTFGERWLSAWLAALRTFSPMNYVMNLHEQVSLMGFASGVDAALGDATVFGGVGAALALIASAIAFLYVCARLQRAADLSGAQQGQALFDGWLLMGTLLPLISPQTLYYDLGISVLAAGRFFNPKSDRIFWSFLLWLALVWLLIHFRSVFAVSPLVIISFMLFFFVERRVALPKLNR